MWMVAQCTSPTSIIKLSLSNNLPSTYQGLTLNSCTACNLARLSSILPTHHRALPNTPKKLFSQVGCLSLKMKRLTLNFIQLSSTLKVSSSERRRWWAGSSWSRAAIGWCRCRCGNIVPAVRHHPMKGRHFIRPAVAGAELDWNRDVDSRNVYEIVTSSIGNWGVEPPILYTAAGGLAGNPILTTHVPHKTHANFWERSCRSHQRGRTWNVVKGFHLRALMFCCDVIRISWGE